MEFDPVAVKVAFVVVALDLRFALCEHFERIETFLTKNSFLLDTQQQVNKLTHHFHHK